MQILIYFKLYTGISSLNYGDDNLKLILICSFALCTVLYGVSSTVIILYKMQTHLTLEFWMADYNFNNL